MAGTADALLPLSRAQLGIWFADQAGAKGGRYQIAEYFDIAGPVDPDAFRAAWTRAWTETDALRVRVTDTPAGPRQSVRRGPAPRVDHLDLAADERAAGTALAWMRQDLARPLDVTREPACTVCLFRIAPDRYFWYQRAHHLAIDGFGAALFAQRVADLYGRPADGPEAAPFAPLTALLADEEAYRESAAFAADRDHWTRKLADRPAPVSLSRLPRDAGAPVLRHAGQVPAGPAERLRAALGRSVAPAVVAAVAACLHHATGADDVLLSLPVTARRGALARATPGMLSNVVPVRLAVRPATTWAELTRQAAEEIKRALPHQRYRSEDLHRDLGYAVGEQGATGPLVNVMTFPYAFRFGGHAVTAHNLSNGPVDDLAVGVCGRQDGAGLSLDVDGSAARYDAEDLAHVQRTLRALLETAADEPHAAIGPAPRSARRWPRTTPVGPVRAVPAEQPRQPVPETSGETGQDALAAMLTLFRDVLGTPDAGPDDAFFDLGGDSITAIQLVARARESGWAITLKQVFAHETPAGLARVAEPAPPEETDPHGTPGHDTVTGPVSTAPVMEWLCELGGPVDTYHQSVLVRAPVGLTEDGLRAALGALVDHHDMLRARLVDDGGRWHLDIAPAGSVETAALVEHVTGPPADPTTLAARAAAHLPQTAARLDPWSGAMLRACWFDAGRDRPGVLLLVVHHLAVDGASWHTLLRDLALARQAHDAGAAPELPPVGTSFGRWSSLLREEAGHPDRLAELPHWKDVLSTDDPPLGARPLDPATDTAGTSRRRYQVLDHTRSAPLLTDAPAAVHGTVPDVLLTALARAVVRWRRERGIPAGDDVLVDVEGHGRETDGRPADLSRTVGWFTSIHPVRLTAATGAADVAVMHVKEQLRAVPGDGLGHGLLRHLNPTAGPELAALARPQILFNYLGRLPGRGDADWTLLPGVDALRDGRDPRTPAGHGLTLDVLVRDGAAGPEIQAAWSAPAGWLAAADLDRVAELWDEALADIAARAGGRAVSRHTPSDLTLTGLSQAEVDELEAELEGWD
ncbi:condensation domain-containing protein [Streptomyces sp. NPDC018045]|uniref:condensation domain-containing protein n=1 Tax=Streptomyces sp. NPDC018045 TaxID=3365037 RepID=UPI0037877E9A